jgi:hypothetical protein
MFKEALQSLIPPKWLNQVKKKETSNNKSALSDALKSMLDNDPLMQALPKSLIAETFNK